jgi:pimeloyl-ACP methyl ester carboxylesterase
VPGYATTARLPEITPPANRRDVAAAAFGQAGGKVRSAPLGFFSDSLRLDGVLHCPDAAWPENGYPLVVVCSGFLGLHRIHPARFARILTRLGYCCFSFDYRGYGESEGIRNRVLIEEQVRDIRNAVSITPTIEGVDHARIFVLGWAMGGGLVVDACRDLPNVKGIVAVNGLFDGVLFQESHRNSEEMADFRQRVEEERQRRSLSGIADYVDPFEVYPLDPETLAYVRDNLDTVSGYESSRCSFEIADSLLRWSVLPVAPSSTKPLFVAHGDRNLLHEPAQAVRLAEAYGGLCELKWLQGVGHTEWMQDGNQVLNGLCADLVRWMREVADRPPC